MMDSRVKFDDSVSETGERSSNASRPATDYSLQFPIYSDIESNISKIVTESKPVSHPEIVPVTESNHVSDSMKDGANDDNNNKNGEKKEKSENENGGEKREKKNRKILNPPYSTYFPYSSFVQRMLPIPVTAASSPAIGTSQQSQPTTVSSQTAGGTSQQTGVASGTQQQSQGGMIGGAKLVKNYFSNWVKGVQSGATSVPPASTAVPPASMDENLPDEIVNKYKELRKFEARTQNALRVMFILLLMVIGMISGFFVWLFNRCITVLPLQIMHAGLMFVVLVFYAGTCFGYWCEYQIRGEVISKLKSLSMGEDQNVKFPHVKRAASSSAAQRFIFTFTACSILILFIGFGVLFEVYMGFNKPPHCHSPAPISGPGDPEPTSMPLTSKLVDIDSIVTVSFTLDPNAVKPDDWDEDAPMEIVDEDAVKPGGWLDDEPEEIDDPEATKPEDWDDEENGEWEAPKIDNPACEAAPGCGEWKKPMKANPAYKGKWSAPRIDNPNYKGIWKPQEIPNPNYFELDKPDFEPIVAVGIENWTMQDDLNFDNNLTANSEKVAEPYMETAWKPEFEVKKERKVDEEATGTDGLSGFQDLIEKAEKLSNITIGVIVSIVVIILTVFFKVIFGGKKQAQPTVEKKPEVAETSTCGEKAEEEEKEETAAAPCRRRRDT